MENNSEFGVVLLSAGSGSRMNSSVPKQYLKVGDFPVLYYSLKCFDECEYISEIVIVAASEYRDYIQEEIIKKGAINKVSTIVEGGKERYNSVYNGLRALGSHKYVMVHDGARPCITQKLLNTLVKEVMIHKAVVPAVPSKDTIRLADENGIVISTPDRKSVWNIQTPQTFDMEMLREAFEYVMANDLEANITDDAMVWELAGMGNVKLAMGDYSNIKLTTAEDMNVIRNVLLTDLSKTSFMQA